MLGLIATALSFAAQAGADQAASVERSDEIVVEGERGRDRDGQIDAFVRALADTPRMGQLSRFDWAVCPAAVGLSPAQNSAVVARMRQVAAGAGIKTAPADCKPNALLIVTGSKGEMIEGLRKNHPAYFSGMSGDAIDRLARDPSRAVAWQVEGRLNSDGLPLAYDTQGGYYIAEATGTQSRIAPNSKPHFIASVLVVEIEALRGLTVTQVADYAAMRTFARTDPQRAEAAGAPTILTILDAPMGSAVPVTMTAWDLGYLKALYNVRNHYAQQQRGDIKRELRKELEAEPGAKE